jgi:aminomuconate-semialdehyde/2-hydroxymuconate-6-semialdehyde dehydrogenase
MTVKRDMPIILDHYIDGRYVQSASQETFASINPARGTIHATVALGGKEEIDLAARAAQAAFQSRVWSKKSMAERCAVLGRVADLLLERLDEFAELETIDNGKPITETSQGDIPRSAQNFRFFSQYAQSYVEECYTANQVERHIAIREPIGVCGLITPWNLPLYLATWKIAPALAMGNSVVLKPAEATPATATRLASLLRDAGVPDGVFNVVNGLGAGSAGEALTRHPLVRSISFTGETATGRAIMRTAADSLKKLSFELGGKGANIIFADADLNEAIPTAVRAAFRNQGQICLAGSRLFVERKIYKQVVEAMVEHAKNIRVGDPLAPDTQMGALVTEEHLQKVMSYLDLAKRDGRILCGGYRIKDLEPGLFLSPSIVVDLAPDSRFMLEEIFGPTLPILPFDTEEEALQLANSTPYGLSASVWSQDIDRIERMTSGIKAGMIWVNTWFARDLRTPFGGQKDSGLGREGGRYSLEFFSEAKTISYKYRA